MQERIIMVSNRLPYRVEKKGNKYELKQSSGGLVSAIKSVSKDKKIVWIGAADFKEELWHDFKKSSNNNEIANVVPLFLNKKVEKLYYNGFSNTLLWPLFHYFPSFAEYDADFYKAYQEINQIFADAVKSIVKENDLVWVHDYHLMLLPGLLKREPNPMQSSFFLHIPFPSYEIIKLIPEDWRNDILHSLLCSDVVGFQTQEYVYHFKKSLSFFLGKECRNDVVDSNGHTTKIKEYPISIDFDQFNSAYDNPQVARGRELIRKRHSQTKIIFSIDRLDYSKGVINRLQAYEQLIQSNPSLRGNIVFIINVVPSREEISKYAERKKIIEENISRINGLYGSFQWQPVLYQYQHLSLNALLSCYTACDVALVTPLRDGMNLVAKEFVVSRKDKLGSLILSEFAGAASELKGAILVNPNDVAAMQSAILKAIKLTPPEQKERITQMQEHLKQHDVNAWSTEYFQDMRHMKQQNLGTRPHMMSFEDRLQIMEAYRKSCKRLILLDYDGTLIRFYDRPQDAVPGEVIKDLLSRLTENPFNKVVLISGRDAATLNEWFGHMELDIAAEHGLKYKEGGNDHWIDSIKTKPVWKNEVRQLIQKYADEIQGSFIEEKEFTIAWHYRAVEDISVEIQKMKLLKELLLMNNENRFDILSGNKVLEVKCSAGNKGKFIHDMLLKDNFDFVLAIGDDVTDEDMFSVLSEKHHYSVKVGLEATCAKFNLINVNNVLSFIDQLSLMKNKLLM